MPAVSQAQRAYLNARFGHDWVVAHHFDNTGPLPARIGADHMSSIMDLIAGAAGSPQGAPSQFRRPTQDPGLEHVNTAIHELQQAQGMEQDPKVAALLSKILAMLYGIPGAQQDVQDKALGNTGNLTQLLRQGGSGPGY